MKQSLKYNSIAVLCDGAQGSISEGTFRFMGGCQSTQLTFTSSIQPEKELGNKRTFYRNEFTKDIVELPLAWYPSDFENEERVGLNMTGLSGQSLCAKLFSGFRTNFMVVVDDRTEIDLLQRDMDGVNAIFIANADIISYALSASVGKITEATASFECDDAWLNVLSGFSGQYTGISDGQRISKPFQIHQTSGKITDNFDQVFVPSGISVRITDRYDNEVYDFNISSISLAFNFDRNKIQGFGSKYDYARNLRAPVYGSISMDIQSAYFSGRQYPINPTNESGFDIRISLSGTPLRDAASQNFVLNFTEAFLRTDSTPFQIGQRSTNSLVFDLEDHGSDF